jgi:hypothetical protein
MVAMRVIALLCVLAGVAHADGETSLALEEPTEAWDRPGFRITLAIPYGELVGVRGAPSGNLIGGAVRAGLRLDADWSTIFTFQYELARTNDAAALGGFRFSGTIDPTWHVSDNLALAVGVGFGGIIESGRDRPDPEPTDDALESSYTFPDAETPIGSCTGVGVAALARAEWSYVLSARASASVAFELFGQWTGCVDDVGRVEPDTGAPIVRRQWWAHTGGTLSIGVTFR